MEVYVDDESKLTLHGLQQHYVKLKDNEKNRKLFELLDVLEFNQVRQSSSAALQGKIVLQCLFFFCSGGDLRQVDPALHGPLPTAG